MIVFGSEYRTAAGMVKPGISAHKLLLGGPAAIAVAPAGLRSQPVGPASTRSASSTRATRPRGETAESLAAALGATRRRASTAARSTCCVVGSRPESAAGQGRPSAPPATTRSRRRPTRCSWSPAARRSASRRLRPSLPLPDRGRRPRPRGRGRRSALRGLPLDLSRLAAPRSSRPGRQSLDRASASTSIAAGAGAALWRPSASARTAGVTSSAAALGVRPALAEGEVGGLEVRALEDLQLAPPRFPLVVAQL